MAESGHRPRRLSPAHYPIVIRQSGPAVRAINYDFGIEIAEYPVTDETEAILQIARLIQAVRLRISEHLNSLERAKKNHPIPLSTEEILSPKTRDALSIQEAAKLLGEAPHTLRRMADDEEIKSHRTRKGHRRFLRSDLEAFLLQHEIQKTE